MDVDAKGQFSLEIISLFQWPAGALFGIDHFNQTRNPAPTTDPPCGLRPCQPESRAGGHPVSRFICAYRYRNWKSALAPLRLRTFPLGRWLKRCAAHDQGNHLLFLRLHHIALFFCQSATQPGFCNSFKSAYGPAFVGPRPRANSSDGRE
jgi:hypothetical protein